LSKDWRSDVLKFWFSLTHEQHFGRDETLDHQIKQLFLKLWAEKRQLPVDAFLREPLTALAAVILFDQLPRNMFRGSAEQFATDHIALAIAKAAIDKGFDEELPRDERAFLFMPFQHSEKLSDQVRSVLLFTALADPRFLPYAKRHHDVIERFGRFPHRNAMLGRAPRADELAAGDLDRF
jgi:uncharacterized protein (DUF924 family)